MSSPAKNISTFLHVYEASLSLSPLGSALRIASGAISLAVMPWAQAGIFVVTGNGDAAPAVCPPGTGIDTFDCATLRDAIAAATADNPGTGAPTTIDLTSITGTITLSNGPLSITTLNDDGLLIEGPGANQLTISGNGNSSRIFYLKSNTHIFPDVTISGLALTMG